MIRHLQITACVVSVAAQFLATAGTLHAVEKPDFRREVLPVLSDKCFLCHGPDAGEDDPLRLDSYEGATALRDGIRAIHPDNLEKSELIFRIHDEEDPMPPTKAKKPLTEKERDILTRWVKSGAEYKKHWAFVPPVKSEPPHRKTRMKNPVDAFVVQQLKTRKIKPAKEADKATLARRAALTLTGLPLDPDLLDAFLNDRKKDAYERLLDELMTTTAYAEHQARYWLDAVRYGDTHGLHLDNRRGIYPYRDWVVYAFSRNLPLDEFITWQMAGDLLPGATLEQKAATGFIRMNPTTAEGGVIPEEFQAKNSFDRTENIGTVLLGMTLNCARCHTHKYDPITQTEYFRLLAFFNNTEESPLDGNKYEYPPNMKAPGDLAAWKQWSDISARSAELLVKSGTPADSTRPLPDQLKTITDDGSKDAAQALINEIMELQKNWVTTLIAKERKDRRPTRLLARGEYNMPSGDALEPDIIEVMGRFPEGAPRNRLGLAEWMTSRENPLVARVTVNRIWQRVFGYGLVRTPADFGLQGEQPTHPELLDWLAVELMDSGWDLRRILKLMMTSKTFRQNSAWREGIEDPQNRLLARGPGYRMDAEVIRDVALSTSGLLNEVPGGEGIKPYQPKGLWSALMHPGSNTKNYVTDKGDRVFRRSLYVYWKRTSPHPMMTLFDAPSREVACVVRSRSNTPLQSLGLLNENQRQDLARGFGARLLKEADSDSARLNRMFTLIASRPPHKAESAACFTLLNSLRARYQDAPDDALAYLGEKAGEADDPAELAAWSQLAATVLASDLAILMY